MLYQSSGNVVYDVNMKDVLMRMDGAVKKYPHLPALFIRLGLATVFFYVAIASTLNPTDWVGYLPAILTVFLPAETLLMAFSVVELALAVWLLSGVYVRFAAVASFVMLGGIVISNFALFDISFRDLGLMFAALALVFMPTNDQEESL